MRLDKEIIDGYLSQWRDKSKDEMLRLAIVGIHERLGSFSPAAPTSFDRAILKCLMDPEWRNRA